MTPEEQNIVIHNVCAILLGVVANIRRGQCTLLEVEGVILDVAQRLQELFRESQLAG
jgi:hypothetical protein